MNDVNPFRDSGDEYLDDRERSELFKKLSECLPQFEAKEVGIDVLHRSSGDGEIGGFDDVRVQKVEILGENEVSLGDAAVRVHLCSHNGERVGSVIIHEELLLQGSSHADRVEVDLSRIQLNIWLWAGGPTSE